jgi:hypothetical protein
VIELRVDRRGLEHETEGAHGNGEYELLHDFLLG